MAIRGMRRTRGTRGTRHRPPQAMTRTALPGLPFAPDSRMTVGNPPQMNMNSVGLTLLFVYGVVWFVIVPSLSRKMDRVRRLPRQAMWQVAWAYAMTLRGPLTQTSWISGSPHAYYLTRSPYAGRLRAQLAKRAHKAGREVT